MPIPATGTTSTFIRINRNALSPLNPSMLAIQNEQRDMERLSLKDMHNLHLKDMKRLNVEARNL